MVWNFYIFENGPNTVDGLADRRGCGVDHSSFLMSGRQIFSSRRTGGPTGVWGRPLIIFDEWFMHGTNTHSNMILMHGTNPQRAFRV